MVVRRTDVSWTVVMPLRMTVPTVLETMSRAGVVGAIEGLDRLFLGLGVAVVTEETSSSSSLPKFMPMRTETGLGSSVDAESRCLLATPTNCQLASNKATQLNTVESSILNLSLYFSSFLSWGKSLHENYLKTSQEHPQTEKKRNRRIWWRYLCFNSK